MEISVYQLSNATFLKEIQKWTPIDAEQRFDYIKKLESEQRNGSLTYDMIGIFDDLKSCYADIELWSFLEKFGTPILSQISPSEQPTTDEEVVAAKRFEDYQQASESSSIPIPSDQYETPSNEYEIRVQAFRYARSYYHDILEVTEELTKQIEKIESSKSLVDIRTFVRALSSFSVLFKMKNEPTVSENEQLKEIFEELSRLSELMQDKIYSIQENKAQDHELDGMLRNAQRSLTNIWARARKNLQDERKYPR